MTNSVRKCLVRILSGLYQWSLTTSRLHGIGVPERVLPTVACLLRAVYSSVRVEKTLFTRRRKLKVVFVVSDVTKWKGQTIYDRMLASKDYDPFVMPTVLDKGFFKDSELALRYEESERYFSDLGLRVVPGYDAKTGAFVPICDYAPDIVIYLQPWGIDPSQDPIAAAACALTFYLPYFVASLGDDVYELCRMPFIRLLYGQFSQSEACGQFLASQLGTFEFGCRYFGVGCPHYELYRSRENKPAERKCVIYSPHWSFKHEKNLSRYYMGTFLENGKFILELAKSHPEVDWIFRPHPGLRTKLLSTGAMSEPEVDAYYSEWARIGEASYGGEYFPLFEKSSAMITDCVTFLTEYLLTGNPLIRLVAPTCPTPIPPVRRLFDAFYDVHSCAELESAFNKVVLKGEDPMRDVRAMVAVDMGCADLHGTDHVMECLNRIFHR